MTVLENIIEAPLHVLGLSRRDRKSVRGPILRKSASRRASRNSIRRICRAASSNVSQLRAR